MDNIINKYDKVFQDLSIEKQDKTIDKYIKEVTVLISLLKNYQHKRDQEEFINRPSIYTR